MNGDNQPKLTSANRVLGMSAAFVAIVLFAAVFAPWISPYAIGGLEEKRLLEAPSWAHWMGTDGLGRDLFTRVLYGARVSITVGLGTALIALVLGTAYGLVAGFKGGNWDHFMMRVVDIFYGLPDMLIFILLSLLFGRNIGGLLVALGLVSWVRFARIARGQVLQAKEFLLRRRRGRPGRLAPQNRFAPYLAKHHRPDHRHAHIQHSFSDPRRIDAEFHRYRHQRSVQPLGHQLGHAGPGRLPRHAQLSACDCLSRRGDISNDS